MSDRMNHKYIHFILCKTNVCRLVGRYLIFANFIFIFCYPIVTLKNWWKEFGSAPPFMICANTRQVSIKKGKKRRWRRSLKEEEKEKEKKKDICILLKGTKQNKNKQTNKQKKQKEKKGKK